MGQCVNCEQESLLISQGIGLCASCIKNDFKRVFHHIEEVHAYSRRKFNLPPFIPDNPRGKVCKICANECRVSDGEKGFCGLEFTRGGSNPSVSINPGHLSWNHDPLPTNCVASWICPAGPNNHPGNLGNNRSPEYGRSNLAVFYHSCNFNCLFCQNWDFHEQLITRQGCSAQQLADDVDKKTACISFFGGDPTPQLPHALETCQLALENKGNRDLRICWETNGAMNPQLLEKMMQFSLESGGCVKFDLKTWNDSLHLALCGVSNQRTLKNFARAAQWVTSGRETPLLIASTTLIPGYVDQEEVFGIARFIASINPEIPYSLLAFHPDFCMSDLPCTSHRHAEQCHQAAKDAGLNQVHICNMQLLGNDY